MANAFVAEILKLRHPAYEADLDRWRRAELRLRAGEPATGELAAFSWEEDGGTSHTARKEKAVALPLMHETARKFVDSVSREAPKPGEAQPDRALSLGTLGEVRPALGGYGEAVAEGTGITRASRAELLWTNVDGVGDDGAPLDTWVDGVHRRAMATGFRWVGVERPQKEPGRTYTGADDDGALRPYAVEFSPAQTPYWLIQRGTLQVLHVVLTDRTPRVENGHVTDAETTRHLLYIREGFAAFGDRFKVGGWWLFKPDGDPVTDGAGNALEGRWDGVTGPATGGAIPFARFFYERDPQAPSGARAGLDEVGSIQTGLMDLESAARHDAHVRSSGLILVAGVGHEAHKVAAQQMSSGSNFVAIPGDPASTSSPSIHDMGSVSASEAVTSEIDRLFAWAKAIATKELTTSPDASGVAKQVEYDAEVSPRLAHMAKMRQEAVAFLIRMFELTWGGPGTTPTGYVRYPRRYSLEGALDRVLRAIDSLAQAGVKSPTLLAKAAETALAEAGVGLTEAERATVAEEVRASAERAAQNDAISNLLS